MLDTSAINELISPIPDDEKEQVYIHRGLERNPPVIEQVFFTKRDSIYLEITQNIEERPKTVHRFNSPIIKLNDNKLYILTEALKSGVISSIPPVAFTRGSQFGGGLKLMFSEKNSKIVRQALMRFDTPEFDSIKLGEFHIVFLRRKNIKNIYKISFNKNRDTRDLWARQCKRTVECHHGIIKDKYFFDSIELYQLDGIKEEAYGKHFTASDVLTISWKNKFLDSWNKFSLAVQLYKEMEPFDPIIKETIQNSPYKVFFDKIKKEENINNILDDFLTIIVENGISIYGEQNNFYQKNLVEWKDNPKLFGLIEVVEHLRRDFPVLNMKLNNFGHSLPFWSGIEHRFDVIDIDYNGLQSRNKTLPWEFWFRIYPGILWDLNTVIDPVDMPFNCLPRYNKDKETNLREDRDNPIWAEFESLISGHDPNTLLETAKLLLDESDANRIWTIPSRALVQFEFGPFVYVELTQIYNEIYFVWRDRKNDYFITSLGLTHKTFITMGMFSGDFDKNNAVEAEFYFIMASIVRDFLVVEEREKIFSVTRLNNKKNNKKINKAPRVIYLPRVRYVYNKDKIINLDNYLDLSNRARHFVSSHIRRATQASPTQLILANYEKIAVPKGYTFVRSHYKGSVDTKTNIIYKSKSALNYVFEQREIAPNINSRVDIPEWFSFEKDMANLLRKIGYQIIQMSQPGNPGGVDIFATKKTSSQREEWLVQCKLYKNTVGVSVVEQLLGSLTDYQSGQTKALRGMVITTSQFSPDAQRLAVKHGIHLMDGKAIGDIAASINRNSG
jgi:hypothetical protein